MFKEKVKGFIAGVCVSALLMGAVTVFAQTIDVAMNGIRVYWDGVEKTLLDAKGNKVEPMIYNGTTYVPLRAMSNLMGKEVSWDQQNMSVYVGERPVAETTPIDMFPSDKIDRENLYVLTGESAKFNLKDKTILCNNLLLGNQSTSSRSGNIYILDGKYSRFLGKAVMPYKKVGDNDYGYIDFYSVTNDGTETEIANYDFKQTEDPIDIDVNLTGVINLKIVWYSSSYDNPVALYDASFLGN